MEEFDDAVNVTRKEREDWLGTDESRSAGQVGGEFEGHGPGRRIVEIRRNNEPGYTDDGVERVQEERVQEVYSHRSRSAGPARPNKSRYRARPPQTV